MSYTQGRIYCTAP